MKPGDILPTNKQLDKAIARRDYCLAGNPKESEKSFVGWVMGLADNAVEVELLLEELCRSNGKNVNV